MAKLGWMQNDYKIYHEPSEKENDYSSMLALGRIYLKNKKSDKAFYYINTFRIECNKSALSKLKIL